MAETIQVLGQLPINRGEFSPEETYYKDNIVQYKNSAYICLEEEVLPSDVTPDTIDNTSWKVFAGTVVESSIEDSGEYVMVISDVLKNILAAIDANGHLVVNGLSGKVKMGVQDDTHFIYSIVDNDGQVLFGIQKDGTTYIPKGMTEEARKSIYQINEKVENFINKENTTLEDFKKELTKISEELKQYTEDSREEIKGLVDALDEDVKSKIDITDSDNLAKLVDKNGTPLIVVDRKGVVKTASDVEFNGAKAEVIDTKEVVYSVVDANGTLLFSVDKNGKAVVPNGLSVDGNKAGLEIINSQNYVFAILDAEGQLLAGIDKNGAVVANSIKGVGTIEKVESDEFIYSVVDDSEHLLFGIYKDGTFYSPKFKIENKYQDEIEDMEFIYVILDKNGYIVWGIRSTGEVYQPKGMPVEVEEAISKMTKLYDNLKEYAESHGGAGDWSDAESLKIDLPRCAYINILTETMPTAKSGMGVIGVTCDIPCQVEVWDMQGNYFKKWVLLSAQGNSSMAFAKKNLAMDFFVSREDALNDGDTFSIKLGNWVAQDSFHFKAYYTDIFRGRGAVSYWLYEEMVKTRDLFNDRPYKQQYTSKEDFTTTSNFGANKLELNELFETGARCFPDGFPCIITWNGDFYGVYAWQLKKHRDNFWMNKKTAEHVHLDGTLGDQIWTGKNNIDWTAFEVRNPKSLYMQTKNVIRGEEVLKYNGDYPREIMGTDSPFYTPDDKKIGKDLKRCATVKKYIQALADYNPALNTLRTSGATNEEIRAQFEKWFDPSFMIDYILETNLVNDGDGYTKNWQWTTYDGVKWYPNPYDHDGIFGAYHIGNWVSGAGSGKLGDSTSRPTYWIWHYYLDEMKARWKELRDAKIFDADHITNLLREWIDRVGYDNWELEYEKWNESPCCRPSNLNADYWKRNTSYLTITNWTETATFAKNTYCRYNSVVYQSLRAGNIGNIPSEDASSWKELPAFDEAKTYVIGDTCIAGKSNTFIFQCIKECNGIPPLNDIYILYPRDLGCYDSIYRVHNWLVTRIDNMDKWFDYTES